ncbi:Os01g0813350 [Oryza sativa Japonica Group]|uniref:Os01g0813350 protein n=1 Tax=Oryza sativa subsp. japonica TaxID=39947 RepID=A0A0P0V9I9_ORYSJ|nr:Os01g0813350 [Oryza sativa Japonica Group]
MSIPPAPGRQRADRVGDRRGVGPTRRGRRRALHRAFHVVWHRGGGGGGGRAGRVQEEALDVVDEAHVVWQATQHVIVDGGGGDVVRRRRPAVGGGVAGAAGRVPGLEVGAVHAERRQDLGDGVVRVVRVTERRANRRRLPVVAGLHLGPEK